MRMIDLFSGLGGASEVMVERGWEVITVDVESSFNPTIVADIRDFHYNGEPVDLIWASPPCIEFSKSSLPRTWRCNVKNPPKPSTELLEATLEVIKEVRPRWWIVENVRGAVPFFKPSLGKPTKRVGSRYLWGDFPIFWAKHTYGKWKLSPSEDRSSLRSKIPHSLSHALCLACEREYYG